MVGSMLTWGHMIWIFFPIPAMALLLLSVPSVKKIDRFGTRLVEKMFFIELSVGPFNFYLIWFFVWASFLILMIAWRSVHIGFVTAQAPCTAPVCSFHNGETMWYRKASRFRAERNWWLSLFTFSLWVLVYKVYSLKKRILTLKEDMETIRSDSGRQRPAPSTSSSEKKD